MVLFWHSSRTSTGWTSAELVALATLVGWGLLTFGAAIGGDGGGGAGSRSGGGGGGRGATAAAAAAAAALVRPYVASVDWAGLAAGHPALWSPAVTAAVAASHGPAGLYTPITRSRGGVDAAAAVVADALLGAADSGGVDAAAAAAAASTAARLAVVAVLSRGFVLGPGGVNVLLPLVDMANHAPPAGANAEDAAVDGGGALAAAVAAELQLRSAAVAALVEVGDGGGAPAARQLLEWEVELLGDLAAAVAAA
ncbi:hypothetical protein I4F81_004289 [Pyropia yezoensis]|uniref:Uncharacterized protein n=1 Tax=Pyropia yezoensis TaxID=2788 RepID=A0ACC3BVV5_PYRYE|nr:hypothetical protein I4F81_004289 [Neopyropia yezoensis]